MVVRVEATGRRFARIFVAKRLDGHLVREAVVYKQWVARGRTDFAPRLLGIRPLPAASVMLFLDALAPTTGWPWGDPLVTSKVVERLACLHASARPPYPAVIAEWDYESLLADLSRRTLDLLEETPRRFLPFDLLRTRTAARRLVLSLPRFRRDLLASSRLGSTVIHGDVHSGNVALVSDREHPVFFDWARARIGSPLEDVSSWLKSLALWEPEAARRHDTILRNYLRARGLSDRLDSELRATYWVAAACNGLAGALIHHLTRMLNPRYASDSDLLLARGWARVIRRAAAFTT